MSFSYIEIACSSKRLLLGVLLPGNIPSHSVFPLREAELGQVRGPKRIESRSGEMENMSQMT
jgi:hypothetical protein